MINFAIIQYQYNDLSIHCLVVKNKDEYELRRNVGMICGTRKHILSIQYYLNTTYNHIHNLGVLNVKTNKKIKKR